MAIDQIFMTHRERFVRFADSYVHHIEAAEDIVSEGTTEQSDRSKRHSYVYASYSEKPMFGLFAAGACTG